LEHFRTNRLVARDWRTADAPAAFAIYGRDEVMRWLGPEPRVTVPSPEQMRVRLDAMAERAAIEPDYGLWPLELRSTGELIGAVLLQPLPASEQVEIGWHLNPDHWGHGYATEAARGALALAFGPRRLDRVVAVVDPDNARSLAVCRRLGMSHIGQTGDYFGLTLELFELTSDRLAQAATGRVPRPHDGEDHAGAMHGDGCAYNQRAENPQHRAAQHEAEGEVQPQL
jgi:RimJ/RimL family protein N-acetyltransferase